MKQTLSYLLTLLSLCACNGARAQFMVDPGLPVPAVKPATQISEYGFQANWDVVSGVEGYFVFNYLTERATADGQKLYLFNTDFSFIETDATTDNPDDNGTMESGWVQINFGAINRYGWSVSEPVYANGSLGLNNTWFGSGLGMNGQIMSSIYDLSLGDGRVYVSFTAKGAEGVDSLRVTMKKAEGIPNITLDDEMVIVTTEWTRYTVALEGGERNSYVHLEVQDRGDQVNPVYMFFDDLAVYQEFKSGEEAVVPYNYVIIQDPAATSAYIDTDSEENGIYAYKVTSYGNGYISVYSDMAYVGNPITGIDMPSRPDGGIILRDGWIYLSDSQGDEAIIYDASGRWVGTLLPGRGTVRAKLPGRGFYIVRIGGGTYKVVNR